MKWAVLEASHWRPSNLAPSPTPDGPAGLAPGAGAWQEAQNS